MNLRTLFRQITPVAILIFAFTSTLLAGTIRSSRFDGTQGTGVRFPFQPQFNRNVEMTIEAWVYREDATRCEAILSQGSRDSFWFGFCPELRFYRSGGSFADAALRVPARQWTHVAASYDGTLVRFHVNGEWAGTANLSHAGATDTGDLWVGRDPLLIGLPPITQSFHGYLDEIRLWSVARSQSQIVANRSREVRGEAGLEAVWAEGGAHETLSGTLGIAADRAPSAAVRGILPSDLVLSATDSIGVATIDGVLDFNTEFQGAEEMVLRYGDGVRGRDGVVHLVYMPRFSSELEGGLRIGISGGRIPASGPSNSTITIYLDGDGSGSSYPDANDYLITVPFAGGRATVRRGGSGFPSFGWGPPENSSAVHYAIGPPPGSFELPAMEIYIPSAFLGGDNFFQGIDRLAIAHRRIGAPPETAFAPGIANPLNSATWARVDYLAPCQSSLMLASPPSWGGFEFTVSANITLHPADGSPSGASLVLGVSGLVSHVRPGASRSAGERILVRTVRGSLPSGQGTADLFLDVFYQVGSPTEADTYGWDFSTTISNPMVDFGTGLEPAVATPWIRIEMDSSGPLELAGTCIEIPALPRTPPGFGAIDIFSLHSPVLSSSYRLASPTEDVPGFLSSLIRGYHRYCFSGSFLSVPSGTDYGVDYSMSGLAGVNQEAAQTVVQSPASSGPGSLREIARANPDGVIRFDRSLDGAILTLEDGPIRIVDQHITIDGSSLPNGITLDAGKFSRLFEVSPGSSLTLKNVTLTGGHSSFGSGGAILNEGDLILHRCTVRNCTVEEGEQQGGGGIFSTGGTLTITESLIEDNQAPDGGGVLVVDGIAIIGETLLQNNLATNRGGALVLFGKSNLELKNSTLLGNSASQGGGIYQEGGTSNTLQVTFHGNIGVAVYNISGIAIIGHSTISGNEPGNQPAGGIVATDGAHIEMHGTIVAGNQGGDLHAGNGANFESLGSNLVGTGNAAGDYNVSGDRTGIADPQLSQPGMFGGLVPTMIPEAGSPARDAGEEGQEMPDFDARGFPRVIGPSCDIGAYEAGSLAAGYHAWAAETIPAHLDRSFGGHADSDPNANGLEYVLGGDPLKADPEHPNTVHFLFHENELVEIDWGYASGIRDAGWRVIRHSPKNPAGIAIIGLQNGFEKLAEDVGFLLDDKAQRVRVLDTNPPAGASLYNIEVFLLP